MYGRANCSRMHRSIRQIQHWSSDRLRCERGQNRKHASPAFAAHATAAPFCLVVSVFAARLLRGVSSLRSQGAPIARCERISARYNHSDHHMLRLVPSGRMRRWRASGKRTSCSRSAYDGDTTGNLGYHPDSIGNNFSRHTAAGRTTDSTHPDCPVAWADGELPNASVPRKFGK